MKQPRWKAILVNPSDNVAVALEDIPSGASVSVLGHDEPCIEALHLIPFAHKMAITAVAKGQPIFKYGVPIAFATMDIRSGEWVHEHNVRSYFVAKQGSE